jgi:hypothetical protein
MRHIYMRDMRIYRRIYVCEHAPKKKNSARKERIPRANIHAHIHTCSHNSLSLSLTKMYHKYTLYAYAMQTGNFDVVETLTVYCVLPNREPLGQKRRLHCALKAKQKTNHSSYPNSRKEHKTFAHSEYTTHKYTNIRTQMHKNTCGLFAPHIDTLQISLS